MRKFLVITAEAICISILVCIIVFIIVGISDLHINNYDTNKKTNEKIEQKVEQKDIFEVRRYDENIYDLVGIGGWFYINEEENEYSIQFYEMGDWDYECKNIKELKNILATYYIQKYDIETIEAIEKVNLIFENI